MKNTPLMLHNIYKQHYKSGCTNNVKVNAHVCH